MFGLEVVEEEDRWADKALATKWEAVKTLRGYVTRELEVARRDKLIGSQFHAEKSQKVGLAVYASFAAL